MRSSLPVVLGAALLACGLLVSVSSDARVDPDNFVGIWLLDDDGGDVADISGNEMTGELTGNPKWVDGVRGGAIRLPGGGETVKIPEMAVNFPSEEVTIVGWARMTDQKNQDFFSLEPLEPGRVTVHMPWDNAVHWQFGTPFVGIAPRNNDHTLDEWTHWAFVHSVADTVMLVYENAEEVVRAGTAKDFAGRGGDFHIGGRLGSSFGGDVDEFAIFDTVVSPDDISKIMDQGLARALLIEDVEPLGKLTTQWATLKSQP